MDHEEDKGAPTMKEAARSAFEAWCAKEYGPRWRLVMRSLCPAVAAWDAWQSASPTGVTADADDEALAAFESMLAIWADALDGKPWPTAYTAPRVKALYERTQAATQCNEGTRSVEAGTSVLAQQGMEMAGPTDACTCKGFDVLKCQRDCEAAPQHNPTADELLRRLDTALRAAWDARALPASVIPAELAQAVEKHLSGVLGIPGAVDEHGGNSDA